MSVNLIVPDSSQYLYDAGAYPHLGLLYLGAVLRKAGYECRYIDLSEGREIPDASFNFITTLQCTYKQSMELAAKLPNVYVGGIGVSINPMKAREDFKGAVVVAGEAEHMLPYLRDHKANRLIECSPIENLDSLPFPDRTLIPREKLRDLSGIHLDRYDGDGAATTMISSRGCPYRCAFCCKLPQTQYFRWRSAGNVYSEMKELRELYDITHIRFVDDCFTVNKRRVFDLCSLLKDDSFHWLCITRTDAVNKELLMKMRKAGCHEIHFGIESGSGRVLSLMQKGTTVEGNLKAVKLAHEVGLKVKVFLMEGFPTETAEDVEQTMKFVEEAQPDKWTLSTFTPLEGSMVTTSEPESFDGYFYPKNESYLKLWLKSEVWRKK